MKYSYYYQAHVDKKRTWLLTSVLRSFEHLAFDRAFDAEQSIFEFFVPEGHKEYFLDVMRFFEKKCIISNLAELPNRLDISMHQ